MEKIFHYCDIVTARLIIRSGVIRPNHLTLHKDIHAQDSGLLLPQVICLTTDGTTEGTVTASLIAAGWPEDMRERLVRFTVEPRLGVHNFDEYQAATGTAAMFEWWYWKVITAAMAGSNPSQWRFCEEEIGAGEWTAVQVLAGVTSGGETLWRDFPYN